MNAGDPGTVTEHTLTSLLIGCWSDMPRIRVGWQSKSRCSANMLNLVTPVGTGFYPEHQSYLEPICPVMVEKVPQYLTNPLHQPKRGEDKIE